MKSIITMLFMVIAMNTQAQTDKPKQCLGKTTKGEPCKSTIILKDGYCRVHSPNTARCGAMTTSGKPCRMPVNKAGDKCRFHQ